MRLLFVRFHPRKYWIAIIRSLEHYVFSSSANGLIQTRAWFSITITATALRTPIHKDLAPSRNMLDLNLYHKDLSGFGRFGIEFLQQFVFPHLGMNWPTKQPGKFLVRPLDCAPIAVNRIGYQNFALCSLVAIFYG